MHGSVPYGYRSIAAPDGQGRTLQPVDDTAAVVRRIFADAKQGDTPGRIAAVLNRDGVSGPRGGGWNRTAVRGIIENVAYAGERYGVKRAHPAIVTRQLSERRERGTRETRALIGRPPTQVHRLQAIPLLHRQATARRPGFGEHLGLRRRRASNPGGVAMTCPRKRPSSGRQFG